MIIDKKQSGTGGPIINPQGIIQNYPDGEFEVVPVLRLNSWDWIIAFQMQRPELVSHGPQTPPVAAVKVQRGITFRPHRVSVVPMGNRYGWDYLETCRKYYPRPKGEE